VFFGASHLGFVHNMHHSIINMIASDYSFPRNVEFGAEPRNLSVSTEFLCFCGILQNSALAGDKGTNVEYFCQVYVAVGN